MADLRCPHCGGGLELRAALGTSTPTAKPINLRDAAIAYATEQRLTGAWSEQWSAIAPRQLDVFLTSGLPLDRAGVATWREELLKGDRSPRTVNLYLSTLSGFCSWLKNRGELYENPCQGQLIRTGAVAHEERLAFSPEEVKALLEWTALYAPTMGHKGLVWGMAYTGARNEEIAQLTASCAVWEPIAKLDMVTLDDGAKRKTAASRRWVPIHPRLEELIRKAQETTPEGNLWGFTNTRKGGGGRYSYTPSRWANEVAIRTLKGQGKIRADDRLTLYSLRHSVVTTLKHLEVPEPLIAELVGHSNASSMTMGRYGKTYPIEKLSEVVLKLDWGA